MATEKQVWERDSFFKVMIGDFQRSLRVPPRFHKHLRGDPHSKLVLRSRGGQRWAVKLRREGPNLFFGEGWECFIVDLAIKLGEFLIFAYDGNLGFDVKIYGISGCEKEELAFSVGAEEEEEGVLDAEQPAEICTGHIPISKRSRRYKKCRAEAFKANLYLKGNATFSSVSSKSRKYILNIPSYILKENDSKGINKTILLDPSGRSWSVQISKWVDGRTVLSEGWSDFYKANHIKVGDICVFKLCNGIRIMDVEIERRASVGREA